MLENTEILSLKVFVVRKKNAKRVEAINFKGKGIKDRNCKHSILFFRGKNTSLCYSIESKDIIYISI